MVKDLERSKERCVRSENTELKVQVSYLCRSMSNRDASAEQEVSRGFELVESMNATTILVQTFCLRFILLL